MTLFIGMYDICVLHPIVAIISDTFETFIPTARIKQTNPVIACRNITQNIIQHKNGKAKNWSSQFTVGELRSGGTGFATIYPTGSHRFMLQVSNDERDEFNLIQKKGEFDLSLANACYHFPLKCHRPLSDFPVGCSHRETTNCDIGSKKPKD